MLFSVFCKAQENSFVKIGYLFYHINHPMQLIFSNWEWQSAHMPPGSSNGFSAALSFPTSDGTTERRFAHRQKGWPLFLLPLI
jgi:hypothetical protein